MYCGNTTTRGRARRRAAAPRRTGSRSSRMRRLVSATALTLSVVGLVVGGAASGQVPPNTPHYFGPFPNWANSPLTLPNANVAITVATGCTPGGATADAVVGANGSITGITITDPGNGYVATGKCAPQVGITGAGTGAAAKATVTKSGAVVGVVVDTPGSGYKSPKVSFSGGGGSGATATAYGGVDKVSLTDGGSGYTTPTVAFDLPDNPNGDQATGHIASIAAGDSFDGMVNGVIQANGVIVDNPGSGYSSRAGCRSPQRDAMGSGSESPSEQPRCDGDVELQDPVDRDGHLRLGLQHATERDHRRSRPGWKRRVRCDRTHRYGRGDHHGDHRHQPGLGLRHPGRDQEVRRHAAGPHLGKREQPGQVHPGRGARHDDVPGARTTTRSALSSTGSG